MSFEDRLWSKVKKQPRGCWIFEGATANGYGRIGAGGKYGRALQAHRVAYELLVGLIAVVTGFLRATRMFSIFERLEARDGD